MSLVTLISPDGNPEVWPEDAAQMKQAEGYRSLEASQEDQAEREKENYREWLNSPDTLANRFLSLRRKREAKIAATDYLMVSDYPISEERRGAVALYRQALRDLPAKEGAPWDGGGKLTPWPEIPAISKTTEEDA